MPTHDANEQYLLELINAERAKAGAQPLAFDNDLSEAAEGHSRWMISTDIFSHTGAGGSTSTQRMQQAGYSLQGSWATGENIAWATTRNPTGYSDEVQLLHTNLMNSSGHRANLLNPNFREVGLGFEVGEYKGRSTAFVTENFGKTGTDLFLTGVAFDDKDGDRFYDPGEGLGGVTVTAKNAAGQVFTGTTTSAGGYDIVLKPGTYTLTFSGGGVATTTSTVTIGSANVKKDLVDPVMGSSPPAPNPQPDPTPTPQPDPTPTPQPQPPAASVSLSANEQYLIELINAERAKAGVQPLAFDVDLSESSEGHSKWMLATDIFSHTGVGGSTSTQRMQQAGYTLQGSWATGENIAWATTRNPTGYADEVSLLHTNLMNSSGHRANILNPNFREIGVGLEVGDYKGRSSAFITENFGKTGTDLFLTGVAFDDKDGDRFYDPGEGMAGITVTVKNGAGQVVATTTTRDAGGYDLALKAGTYTVTFSGGGVATNTSTVTIGTKNVKKDLVDPAMAGTLAETASAKNPTPTVAPTDGGNADAHAWLADFVRDLDGPGGRGDHLHFRQSVNAPANADELSDVFEGLFARFGNHQAAQMIDHALDHHAPADVSDAGHAALAKILAQLAAGHGGNHSDLLV